MSTPMPRDERPFSATAPPPWSTPHSRSSPVGSPIYRQTGYPTSQPTEMILAPVLLLGHPLAPSMILSRICDAPRVASTIIRYFDENLPEDNVPYADFDAPVDSDNPKDSSATAIVASALFELFEHTGKK